MKYHVRDEDGKQFEVEEVEEKKTETNDEPANDPIPNNTADDNSALTSDEIVSLKSLAAVADKLVSLVNTTTTGDGEEEEEEDEEEEVVETEDCDASSGMKKVGDAKKSIGAIEKKKTRTEDSVEEDEVSAAWAKRYNGGNN